VPVLFSGQDQEPGADLPVQLAHQGIPRCATPAPG